MVVEVVAAICLFWACLVIAVATLGYLQVWRHYSSRNPPSPFETSDTPHVTIIRPVKGLDPGLYECLASTFRQSYPSNRFTVYFCVASRDDPALPALQQLLLDFPESDAYIFVEDEDPVLHSEHGDGLGPNPKIRSMSRAYREAKGDLIWIIDCNVWVAKGVCGRMVDALLGRGNVKRPQKLVHQLPLVVDTDMSSQLDTHGLEQRHEDGYTNFQIASTSTHATEPRDRNDSTIMKTKGGRLEELFMSSAHAKFYTAINTVLIAPCLVGKSNMFRRSHLNALTQNEGIDYFSHNICEDHLVGDLLWKQPVPQEVMGDSTKKWGNHALVFGDLAIQPMAHMSVREYVARRVRWLRVRKYTVPAATGVECTTESFFCAAMLSYALTTLPYCHNELGVPQTWTAMFCIWLFTVTAWASVDWTLYCRLHSAVSIDVDKNTPFFAQPGRNSRTRRPFLEWLAAWFGREALAFPVWFWAVFGGATVTWRGKRFWVDMNMKVHEIEERRALLETGLASVSALGNGAVDRRNARKHQ